MIGTKEPANPLPIRPRGSRNGQWRPLARARTNRRRAINAGSSLKVVAIDGVTLEVEPEEGAARDYRERRAKK